MKRYTLEGNFQWLDGGAMFGNAPKTMWSKWMIADEENRIRLASRSLLIDTGDKKVLFELGVGGYMEPLWKERYGVEGSESEFIKNLNQIGLTEEDIDYVIPSHLHFDHAGGLVPDWPATQSPHWKPRFSNAIYVVGKKQFEHSFHPHPRDRASYIPDLSKKLYETKRLLLVDENTTLPTPLKNWLSFHFADGHTPGLMHAIIKGEKETLFFASDMIPGTTWVHVAISMGYDRFAELAIDNKKDILEKALKEKWHLFFTHDPQVVACQVHLNEKGKFEATHLTHKYNGETF